MQGCRGVSRAHLPGIGGLLQSALLRILTQDSQARSAGRWHSTMSAGRRQTLSATENAVTEQYWEQLQDETSNSGSEQYALDAYLTDLTTPASWYPAARKMQRTIIAHMGPTNSGKTYNALQALKAASSGAYCGPLRLLAWEVAEKMNAVNLPIDLITGQEQRLMHGARHIASTVEMASVTRPIEVGVVDEVQMVADPLRGASFTRAVLGLPAKELHVCGDPAALPLLRLLARDAGDLLEVRHYKRLVPLAAARRALSGVQAAQRGDCLVAFSRRDVHSIKRQVEAAGRHSCCMVYGALPPESRAQQAVLFNTARTGYNVLAASDAVGMGLNLNIRRVVFTSLEKFDGVEQRSLKPAEVKQIAGRAGRFGSSFDSGIVTCLNPAGSCLDGGSAMNCFHSSEQEDMRYLRAALAQQNPEVKQACLFPRYEQIALLAHHDQRHSLPSALRAFADRATMAQHYFLGDFENIYALAVMLKHLHLTLREQYLFSISPTDASDSIVASALLSFATAYSKRGVVPASICSLPPSSPPKTELQLRHLEALHHVYDLYIWLAFRLEKAFPESSLVEEWRTQCSDSIRQGLENLSQDDEDWAAKPWQADKPVDMVGRRRCSTAAKIRHFPKHLLRKPGERPRSPLPLHSAGGSSDEDDAFDPKAPLVKPERPQESRSQRRVRKREEGQARVIERDFGKGLLPPFSEDEEPEPDILVPRFGPAPQPKKRKKSAKRKSSKAGPWPLS